MIARLPAPTGTRSRCCRRFCVDSICRFGRLGFSIPLACLLLSGFPVQPLAAHGDIADIPFEQLLHTEIVTADKIARQISDAPSAVSIVTADDIRTHGYRTLSDILDSMRGLSMAHDGAYGHLSGRGYGNPGARAGYAGRITLLIDGYRAPDNLYGQSFFGHDALLDVEMIDRVEYIPGSGSSSYGDSAFLGVINVITKRGRDIDGVLVSSVYGEHGLSQNRVAVGKRFESGLEMALSASKLRSRGRVIGDHVTGYGAERVENDSNDRYFFQAGYLGWTLEAASVDRRESFDGARIADISSFGRIRYDGDLSSNLKTSVHLYYGRYRYRAAFDDSAYSWQSGGDWRGIDAKLVGTRFDHHTIVAGAEYRDDFRQGFWDAYSSNLTSRRTTSLYVYDLAAATDSLTLNFGGRWDARNDHASTFSPRGAVIYAPVDGTVLKLSAGKAHRQMNADIEGGMLNPSVEEVKTRELVWEQMLGRNTRLIVSAYSYRIDNYLMSSEPAAYDADGNPVGFMGVFGEVTTTGFEAELERLWDNGVRLRTSYTNQDTRNGDGNLLENMARHIGKLNLSWPMAGDHLRVGISVRYLGKRLNLVRKYEPAVTVADLTLTGKWQAWSAAVSVRNVGNARYNEVSGAYGWAGIYPADRRNCWVQLEYHFK